MESPRIVVGGGEPGKVTNPVADPSEGPPNVFAPSGGEESPSGDHTDVARSGVALPSRGLAALTTRSRARRTGGAVGMSKVGAAAPPAPRGVEDREESPPGTLGVDVKLGEPLVVEGLRHAWARWPRGGVTATEFARAARRDAALVGAVMESGPSEWAGQAYRRWASGYGQHMYQIPEGVRCDRTWLKEAADASYVERMAAFLFEGEGKEPPVLAPEVYRTPPLLGSDVRERRKTALSASVVFGRVLSFDDFTVARAAASHRKKVSSTATVLMWDLIPMTGKS